MLIQSVRNIVRIGATENWQQAEATVESIEIKRIKKARGDRFYPVIKYNYEVDGKLHAGDRTTFESGVVYQSENEAQYVAEGYLKKDDKTRVSIFYDPLDPSSSTIFRGDKKSEYPLIFYGILFLSIGLLVNRKLIIKTIKRLPTRNNAH